MRFASAKHKVRGQTSPRFLSINYTLKKKSDSEKQTEIVVFSEVSCLYNFLQVQKVMLISDVLGVGIKYVFI